MEAESHYKVDSTSNVTAAEGLTERVALYCVDACASLDAERRSQPLLLPSGTYVLVKRFSAKEERRRVVAAIYDPRQVGAPYVGFENHVNVYHCDNGGLPMELAKGLAVFLNSTLIDSYFRQFNGHTQVNASDLRMLQYPDRAVLEALGVRVGDEFPS